MPNVTKAQMDAIQRVISSDLSASGYSDDDKIIIALIITGLCKAFDEAEIPILHPLFMVALRQFANTLDLIHQLDQERK